MKTLLNTNRKAQSKLYTQEEIINGMEKYRKNKKEKHGEAVIFAIMLAVILFVIGIGFVFLFTIS